MNILVVDDELLIAKGICYMIQKMDIDCEAVDYAGSAEEAMEKLSGKAFDLCLTDICMPDINGLELIATCKKKGLCRSYCIISGYADFEYARQAIRLGVKDYLMKPIDKEILLSMLQGFDLSLKIKSSAKNANNPYVKDMLRLLSEKYNQEISLSDIAGMINLNPDYAGKLFKSCTNFTFSEYLNRYRLNTIVTLMKDAPESNFEQLAAANGFPDIRNFYRVFKKIFSMTPSEYRRNYLVE